MSRELPGLCDSPRDRPDHRRIPGPWRRRVVGIYREPCKSTCPHRHRALATYELISWRSRMTDLCGLRCWSRQSPSEPLGSLPEAQLRIWPSHGDPAGALAGLAPDRAGGEASRLPRAHTVPPGPSAGTIGSSGSTSSAHVRSPRSRMTAAESAVGGGSTAPRNPCTWCATRPAEADRITAIGDCFASRASTSYRSCSTCSPATCRSSGPGPSSRPRPTSTASRRPTLRSPSPGITGLWQVSGHNELEPGTPGPARLSVRCLVEHVVGPQDRLGHPPHDGAGHGAY